MGQPFRHKSARCVARSDVGGCDRDNDETLDVVRTICAAPSSRSRPPLSPHFVRFHPRHPRGGILRFIMMEIRPRPDVARTRHNSQRREVRILSLPLSLSLSNQPAVLWTALFTFLARLVEAGNGFPNVGKPLASENVEED